MNILMVTNTYTPIVGGVERSIRSFAREYRKRGHSVLIITLEFDNVPAHEKDVIRLPAIRRFNGSDFSIRMPIPFDLDRRLKDFKPDIVHAHHPFILGDTALRISNKYRIPLVFTHHTRYEDYTHYVPIGLPALKRFVIEITCGYAELADYVFAPSRSVKEYLLRDEVRTPIEIIPTGVEPVFFEAKDARRFRSKYAIAENKKIIGHVGRLAKEKNLTFLVPAVIEYLKQDPQAVFVLVGKGPAYEEILKLIKENECEDRFFFTGVLEGEELVEAYQAMDVFAFSSKTETQGMVLLEAMAAGTPVVALRASGVSDIVEDGKNGFLIDDEDRDAFITVLGRFLDLSEREKKKFSERAVKKARALSIEATTKKALGIYEKLLKQRFVYSDIENSPWQKAIGSIKSEWELAGNLAGAVSETIKEELRGTHPWLQRCLKWFDRNEWSVRLLRLTRSENTATEPGLVLIQIDGLGFDHLKEAMGKGRMPFLQKLIKKEQYALGDLYSGLPSSTPAVQAELFYGVKGAVPSFSFLDHETKKICRMYDIESAQLVERRLAQQGIGLLEGGSSYSNVYSGGAAESQFCAVDLGWDTLWAKIRPIKLVILASINIIAIIKTIFFMLLELVISLMSFLNGVLLLRQNIFKELKFVLTRISICILLRDLVAFGARIDITRGLPVIHVNLVGYDEHAHRRGPSSRFAYWTLKGIDRVIEKIYRHAVRSKRRDYDVWIYSDHGQSSMRSYTLTRGHCVHKEIRRVYAKFKKVNTREETLHPNGIQLLRSRYFSHPFLKKLAPVIGKVAPLDAKDNLVVTAMGPIGHVYAFDALSEEEIERFARAIISDAQVPLVLLRQGYSKVKALMKEKTYILPDEARDFWGEACPFRNEATQDLIRLVHHPSAGTCTICGFSPAGENVTFPIEEGAHGGLNPAEMHGFALLPLDRARVLRHKAFLRPIDIRACALKMLKRTDCHHLQERALPIDWRDERRETVRIMTYNVHGCCGMDHKIYPERIARVIARIDPDIVALQELDMHRMRSDGIDQPQVIAHILKMKYHFAPTISLEEQQYGNAILSRYPMRIVATYQLPQLPRKTHLEPRGVIWVECVINGKKLQCMNTHLGLNAAERDHHIDTLLSQEWLGKVDAREPVVFAGDFNAAPSSRLIKKVSGLYKDVQQEMHNYQAQATWPGHFPVGRIDHIFVSPLITISHVAVPRTHLEKNASDHLPLIADIQI
jgi:glycosyltransferase involved in cell wall biosynthesis/endonuclease/exonuclease/phosphatase family metal-dependent hydrolase